MREYTVLTINPGSTGTKLGLVRGDEVLLDLDVMNRAGIGQRDLTGDEPLLLS